MESYLNLSCHPASSYHAPKIRRKSDQVIDVIWQKYLSTFQKWTRGNILIEKYDLTHMQKMTLPPGQHFYAGNFV